MSTTCEQELTLLRERLAKASAELQRRLRHRRIEFFTAHPKQADFMAADAPEQAACCGNQGGKSTAGAVKLVQVHLDMHPTLKRAHPIHSWVGSQTGEQQRDGAQQKLIEWLPPDAIKHIHWRTRGIMDRIEMRNGDTITFRTFDMDVLAWAGAVLDLIWLDEIPPRSHYVEAKTRLLAKRGHLWMTFTPVNGMDWTYEHLWLNPSPGVKVFRWGMEDNPFIPRHAIEHYRAILSDDERAARLHGEYVSKSGLVYPEFAQEIHVREFDVGKGWDYVVGIDTGRNFAAVFVAFDTTGVAYVFDEVTGLERTIYQNAKAVLDKCSEYGISPRYFIDPASQHQRELSAHGIDCSYANNDVQPGIDKVKRLLAVDEHNKIGPGHRNPCLFIHPRVVKLPWEMRRYRWDSHREASKLHGTLVDKPIKKNDHALDGLRYALTWVDYQTFSEWEESRRTFDPTEPLPQNRTHDYIVRRFGIGDKQPNNGEEDGENYHPIFGTHW